MKKKLFFVNAFLIVLIDQAIKAAIRTFMKLGQTKKILGEFVKLNYVTNKGGAFSIRRKQTNNSNNI